MGCDQRPSFALEINVAMTKLTTNSVPIRIAMASRRLAGFWISGPFGMAASYTEWMIIGEAVLVYAARRFLCLRPLRSGV